MNDRFEHVIINPTQEQIDLGLVEPYSVYGDPTNTKDSPLSWAYCFGFYIAIWLWTIGLHWLMRSIYIKTGEINLVVRK